MKDKRIEFVKNGFCVLNNVFKAQKLADIQQNIHLRIEECASELKCSKEDYLRNVSRWVDPSPLTNHIYPFIHDDFKTIAEDLMDCEVKFAKVNIISKSPYAIHPVPCHQDIAYSAKDAYQFSLWLALQDVNLEDGSLEFLPGSQGEIIEPAVDFWQPNFEDKMHASSRWQENFVSIPVKAGDIIAFDSRIWHRSAKNLSLKYRFALVSRWSRMDYKPPLHIPEKSSVKFGMWNCGQLTKQFLRQGLSCCFNINLNTDLENYIYHWQKILKERKHIPFKIDLDKVYEALNDLLILHRATQVHNGGDAQGIVYPNIWNHFLNPLSQCISQFEANSNVNTLQLI